MAAINAFSGQLLANASAAVAAHGDRDGAFLTACFQHEETCTWRDWDGVAIGGTAMRGAFWEWYTGAATGAAARRADGAFGSDTTCAPPGVAHGSC